MSSTPQIHTFPVGIFQCNCSIVWDESSRKAIIVDPGGESDKILAFVDEHQLQVQSLVHTHAHYDHIGASSQCQQRCQCEVLLHAGDRELYDAVDQQAALFGLPAIETPSIDRDMVDQMEITAGSLGLKVLHTPGHTPGSCSFELLGNTPLLFTGDTLFKGGVGRTDLWGIDLKTEVTSIKERILVYPDECVIIPGHGPQTTVAEERRNNPYLT